ncbi:hypothetical protein HDA40_001718 [Hamadaea flava]|uniref:Uncharacterized protein n=1 Tax=Hamadaea flava TaxID=1742688 RepID=A0ABV8LN72_9ACTN|nr:hypothetical protein [Hamadaea flava]MCP2323211.1 hypothetical protein [Hamadaea flava]
MAIPLAVGVGYVLGRTHKLKLAILLGAAAAAGKYAGPANEMMQRGARSLTSSTDLKQLTEPGQRLMEAAKGAALTALTGRLNQLSGRLTEGMPSLGGAGEEPDERESDEREPEDREPEDRRERSKSDETRRGRSAARRREEPEPEEDTDEYDEDEDVEEPEEQPREQSRTRQPVRRGRPEPAGRRGR